MMKLYTETYEIVIIEQPGDIMSRSHVQISYRSTGIHRARLTADRLLQVCD